MCLERSGQHCRTGEANGGLKLRIGINLGDIIIEDDGDVFGDGVNVAARLEQMADPGGVLISGKIYEEIEGKIDRRFESRGEQQVKNLARPVRVYALAGATPPKVEPKALPLPDKPSIAVLPFTNMSGDPEQEYFADGIVEDIIAALSRVQLILRDRAKLQLHLQRTGVGSRAKSGVNSACDMCSRAQFGKPVAACGSLAN